MRAAAEFFGSNEAKSDLSRRSLKGGFISLCATIVNGGVQVGSVIFMARLLRPEDYGVVSMVTSLVGIGPLIVDVGTRDAVQQQSHITEREISALFWMTLGCGILFAGGVTVSGPAIAHFYKDPRLTAVAMVGSLTVVMAALAYMHMALLRRAMMFRDLALIDICSTVVGALAAVGMAMDGFGYWALVLRPLVTGFLTAAGCWLCCRWVPGRFEFTANVKKMIRYGAHQIGFSATDFIGKYADRIVIGRASGAASLGQYQNACLIYNNCMVMIATPLHPVAMVGLSKLRNNTEQLISAWSKALSTFLFFAAPAYGLLSVTSDDIVVVLLGAKWRSSSVLLSIMAVRGVSHVAERTVGWLHTAAGRSDRIMRWGVFSTVAQLIALGLGFWKGTIGISIAYCICTFILFAPALVYSGQPFNLSLNKVLRVTVPAIAAALITTAICFVLRETVFSDMNRILRIGVVILAYSICYLALAIGVFQQTKPVSVALSVIKNFLPAKK